MGLSSRNTILIVVLALILFTSQAHAFGAGNIASISAVEGHNWRHGDIEDLLKQVACIRHHKWNSMMIKRVYFGNWLRDYSQAMDVGALKKANAETIRVLVWLLSFLGFGYATAEFEVTTERLGVYRPEEHIDNPKNYNDDQDARPYEPRLRGPIRPIELEVDPETGMKNYIANGRGDWATSAAFVKHSFERSIHFGRQYCAGGGFLSKGKEEDLCEGLRLLGQGLHTLEDFGAHTNYVELALIELGHRNVFPLVGTQTGINLRGKNVFPLVTGTFGMVDFYHSVLGEATDHFTQSEISEMDNALGIAQTSAQSSNPLTSLIKLLSKVPGTRDLCSEAERLQASSHAQAQMNSGYNRGFDGGSDRSVGDYNGSTRAGPGDYNNQQQGYQQPHQGYDYNQQHQPSWGQQGHDYTQQQSWQQPQGHQSYSGQQSQNQGYDQGHQQQWNQQQPHDAYNQPQFHPQQTPAVPASGGAPAQTAPAQPAGLPGAPNFDPAKTVQQIYPILAFRDKVVRTISGIIEKIPGLEALVDKIVETLTVFVLSLLAPFVRPVLEAVSKSLQKGSEGVIDSSGRHQYEVWTDPRCSDPTHSMLSKDHFSNVLNEPAGLVAGEILKFIAPRVLYAWEHPDVPVQKVMQDIESIFHHPSIRNEQIEVHRNMFKVVKQWNDSLNDHGRSLDNILSMDSVKAGKNHKGGVNEHLGHGSSMGHPPHAGGQHSSNQGGLGGMFNQAQSLMGGQHQGGSNQGGLGGMLNQAQHMMGGQHGSGGSYQSHNQQGGMGGMFNQASNLYGQFSGHGSTQHHSSGGYGGSSGGGGGLNDMLNMANKLPIPGVSNFTSTLGKFSSFIPGGRTRGMDDTGSSNTRSISSEDTRGRGQSGYESPPGQSDISVDPAYSIFGGSNVGGAMELRDAMSRANTKDRSPSPAPLAAPAGYEDYSGGAGQSYEGGGQYGSQYGAQQSGEYGGSTGNYYQGGAAGGDHSSYYRS